MTFIRSVLATSLLAAGVAGQVSGASYPPIPQDLTTPVQQRLSIAGPRSMTVGWNTYGLLAQICVAYGTTPTRLNNQVCNNNQTTYPTSRTYFHAVTLTGLTPATTYYYKIGSTNSSVEHFLAPRLAGDKTPFNMDIVVDLGVYGADGFTTTKRDTIPATRPELNHSTIGTLAQTVNDYELIIHPGDFAYADDWYLKTKNAADGTDAFEAILETFYGDQLSPIAGRKAYMASPGNHEANCNEAPTTSGITCPEGQKNFTDFLTRFGQTMPLAFNSTSSDKLAQTNAWLARKLSNPPFWYSFEYGLAHVLMFNTETDFPNAPDQAGGSQMLNAGPFGTPGQQLKFIQADLASVDRTRTPWLIAAGHRPWYSTGGNAADPNTCGPCQAAFEDLFYQYGVDLGVFGHVHNSQRFLPIYKNNVDPKGMNDPAAPAYIIAGGPGNIEGLSAVGNNVTGNVFAYADDFSFAKLKFKDAQHLGIEFYASSNGSLLDSSVLYKSHSAQFVNQS